MIAGGHYLQVTDADWTRAVGTPESDTQSGTLVSRKASQHLTAQVCAGAPDASKESSFTGVSHTRAHLRTREQNQPMGRAGLEHQRFPKQKPLDSKSGDAHCDALSGNRASVAAAGPPIALNDSDLASVAAAWPNLPPAIRAGIVAMVTAAAPLKTPRTGGPG